MKQEQKSQEREKNPSAREWGRKERKRMDCNKGNLVGREWGGREKEGRIEQGKSLRGRKEGTGPRQAV